jgi:hypothetical protein
MRLLAPPHQWFLKLTFLKIELWVYTNPHILYIVVPRAIAQDGLVRAAGVDGITPDFGSDHAQVAATIDFGRIMMCVEHTGTTYHMNERKRVLMATIPKMARRCRELLRHKNNKKQQKWERKVELMYECAEGNPREERSK